MSFPDLVRLTLRHIVIIVASLILCVVLALGAYATAPRVYQADSTGYVAAKQNHQDGQQQTNSGSYTELLLAQQKAKSYLSIITSRAVAERASKALNGEVSAAELASRTTVDLPDNSVAIKVTATGSSAELAKRSADAIVKAAAEEIESMEGANSPITITPLTSAVLPSRPVSPNLTLYLAAGVFAGLLLGYALALVRRIYDTTIRTVEDLESLSDVTVLGVVPQTKEMAKGGQLINLESANDFQSREALRKMRTNLQYVDIDNPPSSVCVTSSVMSEGKSTVSVHLAMVLAQSGQRVLLIDTDLRRPSLAAKLGIDGSIGLTQVLTGSVSLEDAIQTYSIDNLYVLPAGAIPPNPSEILGSKRMHQLVEHLSRSYFVICDAPPVLPVTDAVLLSRATDGLIVVTMAGKANREQIKRTISTLERVNSKIFGFVLNRVSRSRIDTIRYGHGEYGYATSSYSYDQDYVPSNASSGKKQKQPVSDKQNDSATGAPQNTETNSGEATETQTKPRANTAEIGTERNSSNTPSGSLRSRPQFPKRASRQARRWYFSRKSQNEE